MTESFPHVAPDPEYAQRVRASFARQGAMKLIGAALEELTPAVGDRLVAEGFVVKPGRALVFTRGEVHAEKDGKRTLVAMMQQTLMVMHGKPDQLKD